MRYDVASVLPLCCHHQHCFEHLLSLRVHTIDGLVVEALPKVLRTTGTGQCQQAEQDELVDLHLLAARVSLVVDGTIRVDGGWNKHPVLDAEVHAHTGTYGALQTGSSRVQKRDGSSQHRCSCPLWPKTVNDNFKTPQFIRAIPAGVSQCGYFIPNFQGMVQHAPNCSRMWVAGGGALHLGHSPPGRLHRLRR